MKGITKTGFEFEITVEALDDWEILDQLSEMADGNMLYAPKFIKKVLGAEQAKALVAHCSENGRTPTEKVLAEIFDIFGQMKDGKN